jgi:predicted  nucleic acid-binding Zn-ribbon protein
MSTKTLTLPFITQTPTPNEDTSYQAELACVVCMAESERKKPSLLRDAEKTTFIAKVHYPLWVFSTGNTCLIINGLNTAAHQFTFQEPTKTAPFIEEIKKNSANPQKLLETLQKQAKETKEFTTPNSQTFPAVINDPELLSYLPQYFKIGALRSQNQQENSTIPTEVDQQQATQTTTAYMNCQRNMQAHIKGLKFALTVLKEELEFQTNAATNEKEKLKEKLEQETAALKPTVDKAVKKLTQKQDKALATLQKGLDRKMAALEKKREKYMRKLQSAEQKRDAAQRKMDAAKKKKKTSKSSSGVFAFKKYEREVENVKKEVKAVSDEMDHTKKDGETKIKQKHNEYQTAIAQEENKLTQLNDLYMGKIGEKEKQTQEITNQTATLISSLENRIDDLKRSSNTLKSQVETDMQLEDPDKPILAQVPVYLIKYVKNEEERYALFSPTAILEENAGVLKELKKMLSLNPEPKLKSFAHPANKKLHETLNTWVIGKMQADAAFKIKLNQVCQDSNLTNLNSYAQTLNEGLDEIEKKGWMTKEETAVFCKRIMEETA